MNAGVVVFGILQENDVLNYQLITTDAGLQQVCEQARKHAQIALDTEFVQNAHPYYPQLGLIQPLRR